METERTKLRERRQGKLRRALGRPLPGESKEQLDQIEEQDVIRVEQGLVSIKGEDGRISYKHIDDLGPLDMRFVTAAEWVEVGWLKERVERRRAGADAPPSPATYAELPRTSSERACTLRSSKPKLLRRSRMPNRCG